MVPQNVTETIMREQLKHGDIGWSSAASYDICANPTHSHRVCCRAGWRRGHHRALFDRCGWRRKLCQKKLGVSFPGRTLGIHALVADASLSGLNRDVWHHFNDGDMARMITICPLAGTQLFQIRALLAPDDSQNFSADVLTAFLTERIGRTDVRIHSIPGYRSTR